MPPRNLPFPPMEAELVTELPEGECQYEPKWDGLSAGETMFPTRACAAPAGEARLGRPPATATRAT